ncbi:MAG TPA: hypothetical protein VE546_13885 [Streptomyces sp.]|uniref:hypothetical protein n=1 Tax=Streptomyces sp. TaxID=1931 RepID=UPI002D3F8210|nr:hypothetical protein [Streptomyces sp.]HZG04638.1 hypothetical protein [Streptomyces sp.]
MRKTVAGLALVVAATLLTACGGGGGEDGDGKKKDGSAASSAPDERPEEDGAGGDGVTREVTLEVQGKGTTQIAYVAGSNATEQVTLPWKKTVKVTLKGAERKLGVPVTIVPGSVQGPDGQLRPASCTITVDGEKVADNKDGKDVTGCKHMLK